MIGTFGNEKRAVIRDKSTVALRKGSVVQIHQRDLLDESKTHVVYLSLDELRALSRDMDAD